MLHFSVIFATAGYQEPAPYPKEELFMADKNITVTNDVITRATAIKKESAEFEKSKATLVQMLESEQKAYKPGQRNHQKIVDALKALIGYYDTRLEQNDATVTRMIADDVLGKI